MRVRLQIAAIFIAVGLGALTVTVVHDPTALVPRPLYGSWIVVRLMVLASLACFGMVLVLGVMDDRTDTDEPDAPLPQAMFRRAVGLAFLASVIASATFVGASALVHYLDRITGQP